VTRYQKGKTNLDFTEARDSEWQWHQLGRVQVCTSLQTYNHASTSPLSFFSGRMPFLPPNYQQRRSTEGRRCCKRLVNCASGTSLRLPCSRSSALRPRGRAYAVRHSDVIRAPTDVTRHHCFSIGLRIVTLDWRLSRRLFTALPLMLSPRIIAVIRID